MTGQKKVAKKVRLCRSCAVWILSPLAIQLGIALILVLSIVVSTLSFALRSRKAGAAPTIRATFHKLKPGWYTSSRSRSPIRRPMASLLTNSGA
jgi:hypothetical protein